MKRRVAPPDAIKDAPDLLKGLDLYYDAFFELGTCRGGMGGPIPWTAMRQYAESVGIEDGEDFDMFVYLIRVMDNEWSMFNEEKNKG